MTLVPDPSYTGSTTILPSQFCPHVPLDLDQLDGIYGAVSVPYSNWADSRLSCTQSPATQADAAPFGLWANLDPTMENEALMTLLDSTTASKTAFGTGLANAQQQGRAATSDPTPSEHWPYSGTAVAGGDQATLGAVLGLDTRTSEPTTTVSMMKLGAITPIAADWTGAPLGVTWNLPTAAVQNAASDDVAPSTASAQAAENDATLTATSDPTTDNLVTFNATASDPGAYNNDLMLESYLVVPTNGLSADKALALAQLIRFAVGTKGKADITALGAAPATSAMITADLAVAQQLDTEAATASDTTSTTTTTAAGTTATPTGSSSGTTTGTGGASPVTSDSTTGSGSLASTGSDPRPSLPSVLRWWSWARELDSSSGAGGEN